MARGRGRPEKIVTAQQLIDAISGSGGIKSVIAQRMGLHRDTVEKNILKYPTVQRAYNQEVETVGDLAESVILKSIQKDEIETAKWYARVKLSHRGYSEKSEVTQKVQGTLITQTAKVSPEVKALSDEQLLKMLQKELEDVT